MSPTKVSTIQAAFANHPTVTLVGAATAGVALWIGWRLARQRRRASPARRRTAGETSPPNRIDWSRIFKIYITIVTAGLSVTGMTHVMSVTFGFPLLVAIIAATSVDGAAVDFGMEARKAREEGRQAWQRMVVVWALAILSGGLSAAASTSQHPVLEGTVRFSMPMLAMLLNYSWMLPPRKTESLTQLEKGKRTWKLEKARRRLERAKRRGWALRWALVPLAVRLQEHADDRLTKHAMITRETATDTLLEHAEAGALRQLMKGFGVEALGSPAPEQSLHQSANQRGLQSTDQSTGRRGLQSADQSTGRRGLQSTDQSTGPRGLQSTDALAEPEEARALKPAPAPEPSSSGGSSGSSRSSAERTSTAAVPPPRGATPGDGVATLSEDDVPRLSVEQLRILEGLLSETRGVVPSQGAIQAALPCGVSKSQRIQYRLVELGFTPPPNWTGSRPEDSKRPNLVGASQ